MASSLRVLAAALVAVLLGCLWPTPSRADDPAPVTVSITGISAPVLDLSRPDQVVELTGTILNSSATPISYLTVQFWRDATPLQDRAALEETITSPSTRERGRLFSEATGNMEVVTRTDTFNPGQRHTFRIRATVAELGLATNDAVYELGVHVRGIPQGGERQTVGRGQVLAVATSKTLDATAVVQLSAAPSRTGPNQFANDSLAKDLTSRLTPLLAVAERRDVVTLLDPLLLQDVRALSKAHFVGSERVEGIPAAADWVERVEALQRSGRVLRLPFSNPSPERSTPDQYREALTWASRQVDAPEQDFPQAAVVGEAASRTVLDQLEAAGVSTVFSTTMTPGRDGALTVVRAARPGEPGPNASRRETPAQRHSRQLAEDLLIRSPRAFLLSDPDHLDEFEEALRGRRIVRPGAATGSAAFTRGPGGSTTWPRLEDTLYQVGQQVDFWKDLTGIDQAAELTALRATVRSSGFASEDEAVAWVKAFPLNTAPDEPVTISAAQQFIMGARTNTFPITVTNHTDVPVEVRLAFTSSSPERITIPTTDTVSVGPGENLTVNVSPEASSSGAAHVVARLQTRSGTTFGPEAPIQIAATDTWRVGWIIVLVSGAVVLGGTFLRIRAVQAEKARKSNQEA